jgi:hypothetical protein
VCVCKAHRRGMVSSFLCIFVHSNFDSSAVIIDLASCVKELVENALVTPTSDLNVVHNNESRSRPIVQVLLFLSWPKPTGCRSDASGCQIKGGCSEVPPVTSWFRVCVVVVAFPFPSFPFHNTMSWFGFAKGGKGQGLTTQTNMNEHMGHPCF